ncbi:hypothetical protein VCHA53O466_50520 [Vibrio chagasii]|nr:hypothetical protein VCHA53O466_50520 [Vibrio chagasii]
MKFKKENSLGNGIQILHTFSVNEAVDFIQNFKHLAAPVLLDAHTLPEDREAIMAALSENAPEVAELVAQSVSEIQSENPSDMYQSHMDFMGLMVADGLNYIQNTMLVKLRPRQKDGLGDYSEPMPIPDNAVGMYHFLMEFGSGLTDVTLAKEFNSGKENLELLRLLKEDGSTRASDIYDTLSNDFAERVVKFNDPDVKVDRIKELRELMVSEGIMNPEDLPIKEQVVPASNMSLSIAKLAFESKQENIAEQPSLNAKLGVRPKP